MKTYKLTTLQDVFEMVPKDRIKACLDEIAQSMLYAHEVGAMAGEPLQWVAPCEWIDDGQLEKTIELQDTDGGPVLTFFAKEAP